jgi:hypothetical protein
MLVAWFFGQGRTQMPGCAAQHILLFCFFNPRQSTEEEKVRIAGTRGHWMEVEMKTATGRVLRKEMLQRQATGAQ